MGKQISGKSQVLWEREEWIFISWILRAVLIRSVTTTTPVAVAYLLKGPAPWSTLDNPAAARRGRLRLPWVSSP